MRRRRWLVITSAVQNLAGIYRPLSIRLIYNVCHVYPVDIILHVRHGASQRSCMTMILDACNLHHIDGNVYVRDVLIKSKFPIISVLITQRQTFL